MLLSIAKQQLEACRFFYSLANANSHLHQKLIS
jgi:hypothetical protein